MGKYLDLDDVAADNPKAMEELEILRAEIKSLENSNNRLRNSLIKESERINRQRIENYDLESDLAACREELQAARQQDRYSHFIALRIADERDAALKRVEELEEIGDWLVQADRLHGPDWPERCNDNTFDELHETLHQAWLDLQQALRGGETPDQ